MNERTLLDYWFVLYRHRLVMLVVVVAAIATALVLSRISPRVYEAKTVFFVSAKSDATRFMAPATATLAREALKPVSSEDGNAPFVGMLKSADLAYRVAERVPGKSAADLIRKDVDIDLTDEYLISVYVRDRDPARAAAAANAYADEFNAMLARMSAASQQDIVGVLEAELARKREHLASLEARYQEFAEARQLADVDKATALLMERRDRWARRLQDLSAEAEAIRRRLAGTRQQWQQERRRLGGESQTILDSPTVTRLRSEMVDLESRLQEARLDLSDEHEEVRRLQTLLGATRERLRREFDELSARQVQAPDLFTEELRRQWVGLEVEAAAAEARVASQRRALATLDAELASLPALQRQARELSVQIDYERGAIAQMQANLDEARAQLQRLPRLVAVVEKARPPAGPKYPLLWLNAVIAAIAGFLAAIVMVFYLDYLEQTERVRLGYVFRQIERAGQ